MNKISFLLSLLIIIGLNSCKKKECESFNINVLDVSYSDDGKMAFFGFSGSVSYSDIEMEYGTAGYTAGNGTKFTNFQLTNLSEGTYDAYVKLQCDGDTWSDWSQKKSFTILDSTKVCFPPVSTYVVDLGCEVKYSWYKKNKGVSPNYYQVEYGSTGFALGTGTTAILNGTEYRDAVLTEGIVYDFYVRSNCGGSSWSEYSALKSFYAPKNFNKCLLPKNVNAERNGSKISYSFESDGDCAFEYTLIKSSQNVGDEEIYSTTNLMASGNYTGINSFSIYHFMVRTVCKDGTKSDWVTIKIQP